ncbi:MAG: serine hydrolase [Chloroflexi bacterium]|nr:serine hydrolase [Chloroflexota bacterium]
MTRQIQSIDVESVTREFNRQIEAGIHSAATLAVFKDGEPIVDIVRGARHPLPLFRVFSMGKPLAAAVIWRYKAQNRLDWDTRVAEFWPEFGTRGKSAITIGHVLSHTAGLSSHSHIPAIDYMDWGRVISHIEDMSPETEPGTTVHYHSRTFGWLVGELVARVSRLSFDEAFAREVKYPLGLKNTGFTVEPGDFGRVVPLEAPGDWPDPNLASDMDSVLRSRVMLPSGSLVTTAYDAAKFYSAISGKGTINGVPWLPESVIKEVTTLRAEGQDAASGNYSRVGLGVRLPSESPNQYASANHHDTVGHGGMGTCTGWASLDNDVSVAYITNRFQQEAPNKRRLFEMSVAVRKSLGMSSKELSTVSHKKQDGLSLNPQSPGDQARIDRVWPGAKWEVSEPEELGLDRAKLAEAGRFQADDAGDRPYRILIARHGKIVAEWNFRTDPIAQAPQASASKSTFSSVLGIAVEEGVIRSENDRVAEYYPEFLDVAPGQGPKEGRHAFPENEGITFRQLIGNTSGYMKPGEAPGKVFNYQTFGMNILTHAIASAYNLYKTSDPERGAGFGTLTEWKIRNPIEGSWSWTYNNFKLPAEARLDVFGYYTGYGMSPRDMARLGWLWLNRGDWNGQQVIPRAWVEMATKVSTEILENEPEERHVYGLGFWCNDRRQIWPDLPADSFAASGAGNQHIWVCPSLDLVVAQSPGTYPSRGAFDSIEQVTDRRAMQGLLGRIADSVSM